MRGGRGGVVSFPGLSLLAFEGIHQEFDNIYLLEGLIYLIPFIFGLPFYHVHLHIRCFVFEDMIDNYQGDRGVFLERITHELFNYLLGLNFIPEILSHTYMWFLFAIVCFYTPLHLV